MKFPLSTGILSKLRTQLFYLGKRPLPAHRYSNIATSNHAIYLSIWKDCPLQSRFSPNLSVPRGKSLTGIHCAAFNVTHNQVGQYGRDADGLSRRKCLCQAISNLQAATDREERRSMAWRTVFPSFVCYCGQCLMPLSCPRCLGRAYPGPGSLSARLTTAVALHSTCLELHVYDVQQSRRLYPFSSHQSKALDIPLFNVVQNPHSYTIQEGTIPCRPTHHGTPPRSRAEDLCNQPCRHLYRVCISSEPLSFPTDQSWFPLLPKTEVVPKSTTYRQEISIIMGLLEVVKRSLWGAPSKERSLLIKLDFTLLPYFALIWFLFGINRASYSTAYISGMDTALDFKGKEYNYISTIYLITYAVFQMPSTSLLTILPPKYVFVGANVTWSIMTLITFRMEHAWQILVLQGFEGAFSAIA